MLRQQNIARRKSVFLFQGDKGNMPLKKGYVDVGLRRPTLVDLLYPSKPMLTFTTRV
ncbi:hypothetical protein SAMN05216389_10612 [Oceanobacillus limi]|uniref:Uncharacterized protein n=1 Tax=Oceanobacillus limi TaxID=930131 RepID=A0A1I0C3F8_9BACI|nr:hypothetical protein SAMN05216389_10612 [Oceanobacillus limi]